MNDSHDEANEPRWLRLAVTLRATPDASTMARVRARLATRSDGPAWVRWLAHPVALVASAAVLAMSVFAGSALLTASSAGAAADTSVVSTLLGDDGSYGLPIDHTPNSGAASSDSEGDTL